MRESDLPFDRDKHICYTKHVKKVILAHIDRHWKERREEIWEKVQQQYCDFLKDMEYMGGKKNSQSDGVYDSIALFAYYRAVPEKPSLEELAEMNEETFVPPFKKMGLVTDMNRRLSGRMMQVIFSQIEDEGRDHRTEWPGNYVLAVEPYDPDLGVRYRFTYCPIAAFAKREHMTSLMPAFCNADYAMMEKIHGTLIRTRTCANGRYCDYWITGDKNPAAADHPRMKDNDGFYYNK